MIAGGGFPHVPGAETVVQYNIKGTPEEGKPSQRFWKFLAGLVAKREIKVFTRTPARGLRKAGEWVELAIK